MTTYLYFSGNSSIADFTLISLQKAFLLRNCTDSVFANRSRPCLLYDIKRCSAPCVNYITKKNYDESICDAKKFLNGNTEKIKEVCKIAKVDNFIENELPLKYDTVVGENGVRLSGGQRQRLSIARALYKDPDIIVLDEATNSLDALTEKNIIEYLLKNYKNTTIIMIAHRLSVLKRCNEILLFDKGKIVDAGTYDFLFENNQVFKLMAGKN